MGKSGFATGQASRSVRKVQQLRLGTCLTGAAALLLLGGTPVRAAGECGILTLGAVTCPPSSGAYPDGIHYAVSGATPQDLTVHLVDGAAIETAGDYKPGIVATNFSGGALSIMADGSSSVKTSGAGSIGVAGNTDAGDLTIHVGDVATSGGEAHGIVAGSVSGAVSVNGGAISTSGDYADGVHATGYSGPIDVTVTGVTTSGNHSNGIYGRSTEGGLTIFAGTIETGGEYAMGINAQVGHAVGTDPDTYQPILGPDTGLSITAGSVKTAGIASDGIDAINLTRGATSVTADTVITKGDGSFGVYAGGFGDVSIKAGSVETGGAFAAGLDTVSVQGDITVTANDVTTHGNNSVGINAVLYGADTSATITAASVRTDGNDSAGIYVGGAGSYYGTIHNVTVTAGDVTTHGTNSAGVVVKTSGDVTLDAGSVATTGLGGIGILATTNNGDIDIKVGDVTTTGDPRFGNTARGVVAQANFGDVTADIGSVSTSGGHATGISTSVFYGNSDIAVHGDVTTAGVGSSGIVAAADHGTATITSEGAITTAGDASKGIYGVVANASLTVNAISIATSGDNSAGIAVRSVNSSDEPQSIALTVGSIGTKGAYSAGIDTLSYGGDISATAQSIATSGAYSAGITAAAIGGYSADGRPLGGNVEVHAGTIATNGDNAPGIKTIASGTTTITVDTVTTSGIHSDGIHAYGYGPISIAAGTVATTGTGSAGIYANNNVGGYSGGIDITADTVTTSGEASTGIRAAGYQGNTNITVGSVKTAGYGSDGIYGWSLYGDTSIKAGSVETSGNAGRGIVAYSGGTTTVIADSVTTTGQGFDSSSDAGGIKAVGAAVNVQVGTVSTSGDHSAGIYANSNFVHDNGQAARDVTVTAGTVTTTGYGSDGIDAIDTGLGGNVSVTADAVSTQGGRAFGIYARSLYADTDVKVGTVSTVGYGSPGVIAIADRGNVAVTADSVTTYGDNSPGVYATTVVRGADGIHSVGGKASVTAATVATHGYLSDGIYTLGGSTEVTVSGGVATYGFGSRGVATIALTGDAVVHNDGAIATYGYASTGIFAEGYGNTIVDGGGTVATHGDFSGALTAASVGGGDVTIDAGTVSTSGRQSNGLYALARDNYGYGSGNVTITAGDVSTTGYQSRGIVALDFNQGGNVTITDSGTVSTRDDGGYGIVAIAPYGVAAVDANTVSTRGSNADAIYAIGGAGIAIKASGTLSTLGDHAAGIFAANSASTAVRGSDVAIAAHGIKTDGYAATGILALNYSDGGAIDIAVDAVQAAGKGAKGIYAIDPSGAVTITAGTVATTGAFLPGDYNHPFSRSSAITAIGGSVTITADTVSTTGNYAYGVKAISLGGAATIDVGSVSAAGAYAEGVRVASYGPADVTVGSVTTTGADDRGVTVGAYGAATVDVTGPIRMTGIGSNGVFASSAYGDVSVTTGGTVDIAGQSSNAITAVSTGGSVAVTANEKVSIDGFNVVGIAASSAPPSTGDGPHHLSAGITTAFADEGAPTVSIRAGDVSATGQITTGISANDEFGGAISIQAHDVTSTDRGIVTQGTGAIGVEVHSVTSGGLAIRSLSGTDNVITVSGAIRSTDTSAILASSQNGDVTVNVGSGSTVIGGGSTRGQTLLGYYGQAIAMYASHGTATLHNAGTIVTAGDGYAVNVIDFADENGSVHGNAAIDNKGTVVGAVKLTDGDDLFTNSGIFLVSRDSDFGAGTDAFVNSGVVALRAGTTPVSVSLLGLESFQNKGGLVDLRNGAIGDTLTLPGTYVGSDGAALGLDIGTNGAGVAAADTFAVRGAATGHTDILLGLSAKSASLLAKPLTLVSTGSGSSADAFSIANADIGFVHYGLAYDAASGTFGLTSTAGAAVYRALDIPRAEQAIWRRAADGWESHMADKRDARFAGGEGFGNRVWGQFYGGVDNQQDHRILDAARIGTGYRQDYYGVQAGLDLGGKLTDRGGMLFGVTGSFISSKLNGRSSADRTQFDTVSLGAYASFLSGPLFANLLGQYGHDWIRADNVSLGYSDKLKADSYGAQLQVGARLGKDSLYLEPSASIDYVRSDIADLHALGQTLDFDRRSGLTGKIGGRIGSTTDMGGTGKATFYLQAHYVHELRGRNGVDLLSGGTAAHVSGVRPGDYGQGAVGVNLLSGGRLSGFIEGNADVGGGTKGGGGRIGLSFKL